MPMSIKELRARHDLSQHQLALKMGVTQTTVSRWERNVEHITAPQLIKLCLMFGVSADDILGINKEKNLYVV